MDLKSIQHIIYLMNYQTRRIVDLFPKNLPLVERRYSTEVLPRVQVKLAQ